MPELELETESAYVDQLGPRRLEKLVAAITPATTERELTAIGGKVVDWHRQVARMLRDEPINKTVFHMLFRQSLRALELLFELAEETGKRCPANVRDELRAYGFNSQESEIIVERNYRKLLKDGGLNPFLERIVPVKVQDETLEQLYDEPDKDEVRKVVVEKLFDYFRQRRAMETKHDELFEQFLLAISYTSVYPGWIGSYAALKHEPEIARRYGRAKTIINDLRAISLNDFMMGKKPALKN